MIKYRQHAGQSGSGVDGLVLRRWEGPRGATAEQLVEHLRCGTVCSVARWHAAMADAKSGRYRAGVRLPAVMEEIDAGENRWRVGFQTV